MKKIVGNQGIRYIFFGGCTTLVNLCSYALLRAVLGVDMTVANFIAIMLAILFAYVVNRQFVFESCTTGVKAIAKEFAEFVGMRISTMFIEIFGVVFLCCLWGVPEVGAKLFIQVIVLVLNYIFSKMFVFSVKKRTPMDPVKRNCCILGFVIPAVTIAVAFAANKVFPFGDKGIAIIDSMHQYLPFFTEFREKLVAGDSLRYSLGGGLGFNFWATYAYYLASPLSFLFVLFPKRNVIDVMALLVVLKVGLCGLTSAWYFSSKCKKKTYTPVVFAMMFSLSSFIIGYYFNIMWLDSIAMLPLMMMGIERIVRGKGANLYCLSLFYGLYCNYYIGFMLCLFACLYFLVTWISAEKYEIKKIAVSCVKFGWHSLLAGGMAALVLVPAYLGLATTESAENSFPEKFKFFVENLSQLTSQFAFCEPITIADNQIPVNAFCGVAAVVLGILFLMDKKVRLRERIAKLCLILLFYASFNINMLNYIWHGFHVQNGLPNRFSFIFIFVLLTMAFDAWRHLDKTTVIRILLAVILPMGFTLYATETNLGERAVYTYALTLALLLAYGILLLFFNRKVFNNRIFRTVFLGLCAVEMISTTIFGVFSNGTVTRSIYLDEQIAYEKMIVNQEEEVFYRTEMDATHMRNENMFLGADGTVLFSSTMPAATVEMFKGLGTEARTNKNGYKGYTKLVNDIFGVKYVLSSRDTNQLYQMKQVDYYQDMHLYKNDGALELGFMVNDDIDNWNVESTFHFEVQNDFVQLATGVEGLFKYRETIEMEDAGTYTIVLPAGEQVYLNVPTAVDKIEVTTPDYSSSVSTYNEMLYDLGCYDTENYATVTCTLKSSQTGPINAEVWTCAQTDYEMVHALLAKNQMVEEEVKDGFVRGTVTAEERGTLLMTIPYDDGWKVMVDGEERRVEKIGRALIGIDLAAGTHTIEMTYTPVGLWLGTGISFLCVVLYMLTYAADKCRRAASGEEESGDETEEESWESTGLFKLKKAKADTEEESEDAEAESEEEAAAETETFEEKTEDSAEKDESDGD